MGHILVFFKNDLVASSDTIEGAELAVKTLMREFYPHKRPQGVETLFRIVIGRK